MMNQCFGVASKRAQQAGCRDTLGRQGSIAVVSLAPPIDRMENSAPANRFRFGEFELDTSAGELRRNGDRLRIQPQPYRLLTLLVRRAGELVTRDEIRQELWKDGTFVAEKFIARQTLGSGSVWDIGFSTDPAQTFLDGGHHPLGEREVGNLRQVRRDRRRDRHQR